MNISTKEHPPTSLDDETIQSLSLQYTYSAKWHPTKSASDSSSSSLFFTLSVQNFLQESREIHCSHGFLSRDAGGEHCPRSFPSPVPRLSLDPLVIRDQFDGLGVSPDWLCGDHSGSSSFSRGWRATFDCRLVSYLETRFESQSKRRR